MARMKTAALYREGRIWYVSYWKDAQRVRESTETWNRKVAEETRLQREREMILGTASVERKVTQALFDPARREAILAAIDPGSLVEVQTALDEYDKHADTFKRPKTVTNDRSRLNAFFAGVPVRYINDVATKAVNGYLAGRAAKGKFSTTTILRFRETLHAFYEYARKQGDIKTNPIDGVPRPRIPDRDIRFPDLKQIDGVLGAVADTPFEAIVATAIYAGLRREELCWLLIAEQARWRRRSATRSGKGGNWTKPGGCVDSEGAGRVAEAGKAA